MKNKALDFNDTIILNKNKSKKSINTINIE